MGAVKQLSGVVWSEGMYLGPHHFQVQSRYFEDSIQFAASALRFEANGFVGFGLDAEALAKCTCRCCSFISPENSEKPSADR